VLGLQPNEAVVVRNPGGRVTEGFINELMVLATVAIVEKLSPGFELIVMQHTDCGLAHLSPDEHGGVLAAMFGVDPQDVTHRHLADPDRAVLGDIDRLRDVPVIPRTLVVSGLVYDIDNGETRVVRAPTPLAEFG
jgi:carbonic anhydrase